MNSDDWATSVSLVPRVDQRLNEQAWAGGIVTL